MAYSILFPVPGRHVSLVRTTSGFFLNLFKEFTLFCIVVQKPYWIIYLFGRDVVAEERITL